MSKNIIIAPSILAADIGNLITEVKSLETCGADWLHVDIMDGNFVPPITFGDNVVASLKKSSKLLLDVHLMINKPENHIEAFVKAGSDRLIVHQEVSPHLHRTVQQINSAGIKSGVAINPATPVETIFDVLEVIDLALIMTVNPGWGGQKFIASSIKKIEQLKNEILKRGLTVKIEVDGGINAETAKECIKAGAEVLVAGTYILGSADRKAAISSLR